MYTVHQSLQPDGEWRHCHACARLPVRARVLWPDERQVWEGQRRTRRLLCIPWQPPGELSLHYTQRAALPSQQSKGHNSFASGTWWPSAYMLLVMRRTLCLERGPTSPVTSAWQSSTVPIAAAGGKVSWVHCSASSPCAKSSTTLTSSARWRRKVRNSSSSHSWRWQGSQF